MKYTDNNLEVFVAHRAALVDFATPITGCRAKAEDVVQDAFLRFVPGSEPSVSTVAYLYRIVRNLAIDMVRRSAMESRNLDKDNADWLEPAGQASPEELALHEDDVLRVADALSRLPGRDRIAVEMYRLGGYTQAEIARSMGVSSATVHRMIRSAMLQIAKALDGTPG